MANSSNKTQDPKQSLKQKHEEHFHKNHRSAIDYYGEGYADKLLKVTRGRTNHDYSEPRFSLTKKFRR